MPVAESIFGGALVLPWRPSLFNLVLRSPYSCIHLVSDLVDCLAPIEFRLHNLVSLQESLKLVGKLVVLRRDQIHVLVQGVYFTLLRIRFFNLMLVLVFQRV